MGPRRRRRVGAERRRGHDPGGGERRGGGAVQPALRPDPAGEAGQGAGRRGRATRGRYLRAHAGPGPGPEPPRPDRHPDGTWPARTRPAATEPAASAGGHRADAHRADATGPTLTGPTPPGRRRPGGPRRRDGFAPTGDVRARWVVRATEGFTATLPGEHRRLLPMNSSMIVTEPLPPEPGTASVGPGRDGPGRRPRLRLRPAHRRRPDRHRWSGCPLPVRLADRACGRHSGATGEQLAATLRRLLPDVGTAPVAHAWSGVLGVARDWCPAIGVAPAARGRGAWSGRAGTSGTGSPLRIWPG